MHCQGEHRRRASDKLSVLVARELAAKRAGSSARKRGAKRIVTPAAGGDDGAETPADASVDDLADSDAEGPAGDAGKASQAPRGRRLLESDDEENDNNMDEGENAHSGDAAADKRAAKEAVINGEGDGEDGSDSDDRNDAGASEMANTGGRTGSEPEDGDAAKSLARDAAAEAHDSGSDASSESEDDAEVQSPPPAAKKRHAEPHSGAKPASRSEAAGSDEAAPASGSAQEASEAPGSHDSGSDDDVPLLGDRSVDAPKAAVTEVVGAEVDRGSVLPTEVQEEEDDSGSEEVASGCKPAVDEAPAAVPGTAGKTATVAARNTATRHAVTAGVASNPAAMETAAADDDDDAGGHRDHPAAAATPDIGAFTQ